MGLYNKGHSKRTMEELTTLIQDAQKGSTQAFSQLVSRFQNMAYGYAYAVLGDFDLAQDAVQEAFIDAYRDLPHLHEPLAFPTWFKRIVYKHCDRITRRAWRDTSLDGAVALASPQPGPPEIAEQHDTARKVQAAIFALSADQRIATALFYISGYKLQEIADFLEISVQTVKSRLHTARKRSRERMITMVQDELTNHPLPEGFTQQTVEQALRQADEYNQNRQYGKAESLMRQTLSQSPGHPAALKVLNRALMRGKVYGQGRWDLLDELAAQGQAILRAGADEEIYRQVAHTLLAIPAMREAAAFIKRWLAAQGPDLERLGMLAWASGCLGNYDDAIAQWQAACTLAQSMPSEVARLPFIAYTLVDCFAAAGEKTTAMKIARQAWELCSSAGPLQPLETFTGDHDWLLLWQTATLDPNEIAPVLLNRCGTSPVGQAAALAIRAWVEAPQLVTSAAFAWARERIQIEDYPLLEKIRLPVLTGLRKRGTWREANSLAQQIWQHLTDAGVQEGRAAWDWERFNPMGAVEARDWASAMAVVRQEITARGVNGAVGWAAIVFGGAGEPTPPEIVRALQAEGVEAVDEYGMFGWYILAREAARADRETEAFDALQKALAYWSNPPYGITNLWERDTAWGRLWQCQEFNALFDARRARIGPVYGMLHYFPGW